MKSNQSHQSNQIKSINEIESITSIKSNQSNQVKSIKSIQSIQSVNQSTTASINLNILCMYRWSNDPSIISQYGLSCLLRGPAGRIRQRPRIKPRPDAIDGVVPVTLQETFHSWTLANRDWEEWFAPKSHDFRWFSGSNCSFTKKGMTHNMFNEAILRCWLQFGLVKDLTKP